MILAAHQPNFVPYAGFFQKMQQADVFVILGNVQFEKNNYQNRFEADGWNTMSVNRGLEPIKEKRYVNHVKDWQNIIRRHPRLSVFNDCVSNSLLYTNTDIILRAAELLRIETPIRNDYSTELRGTARLVDLCQHFGATKYLSGVSGRKYLDLSQFRAAGIEVEFQDESKLDKRPLVECLTK